MPSPSGSFSHERVYPLRGKAGGPSERFGQGGGPMSWEASCEEQQPDQPLVQSAAPTVQSLFAAALRHHQAGRLSEAEQIYRQLLAAYPGHSDSLHLLGVIACQAGRQDIALDLIRQAIAISPEIALYHSNLGSMLQELGRPDEALECYRRALYLDPDFPEAYYNLGSALQRQGCLDEAAACYRRALELKPAYPEACLGLGTMLKEQGRLEEAVGCLGRALDLQPDLAEAHLNMADALRELGRLEAAVACYRKVVDLKPDLAEAHNNLGAAHMRQGWLDDAVACFRRAVELKPDSGEAHANLGMALLARGDMAAGWQEYEWRWKTPEMLKDRRYFVQPQWRGEPAKGRTLLIHAEQGFGDTLQFCRYALLAVARGLRVVLEVPKPLVRLLRGLPTIARVVAEGEKLPPFDLHCPMLSLPLAFGTVVANIPSAPSYLHANAVKAAGWQGRLGRTIGQGPRIGLVWAANRRVHGTALVGRSLDPNGLAPLFAVPGVRFLSLQKDGPAAPADAPLIDFMGEMEDFADTAALIANLDLVVSVDTAVAHLAAAMGRPVWLLDRFDSCWRWRLGQHDSPWYPTMRLYRQPHPGAWDAVLAEVASDLRGFAEAWRARP